MAERIKNPFKPGSYAYGDFETYWCWFGHQTKEELIAAHKQQVEVSNNYMSYGWKIMSRAEFRAECIAMIYEHRFGEPISIS